MSLDHLEKEDQLVSPDLTVLKVAQEHQEMKDNKAIRAHKVHLDSQEFLVILE